MKYLIFLMLVCGGVKGQGVDIAHLYKGNFLFLPSTKTIVDCHRKPWVFSKDTVPYANELNWGDPIRLEVLGESKVEAFRKARIAACDAHIFVEEVDKYKWPAYGVVCIKCYKQERREHERFSFGGPNMPWNFPDSLLKPKTPAYGGL